MKSFIINILCFLFCNSITVVAEMQYMDIIKSGTFNKIIKSKIEKNKIDKINTNLFRPEMHVNFVSPKNYFLIHYDTLGINAVEMTDLNINGIPDYIDSVAYYFDYVYDVEVTQMGFLSPIPDSGDGGSDHYDIYVLETGIGVLYETFYGLTVNDRQIFPQMQFERYTAFTIIDNNYSQYDSTEVESGRKITTFFETGIEALKITAAHEFHHAIQFQYGIPEPYMPFIFEMTSMAVEHIIFPESMAYLQFVNNFLKKYPDYIYSNPSAEVGYRYGIFAIFLYNKFGIEVLRNTWDNIFQGMNPYFALFSALKTLNSNFDDEFCNFINELFQASINKKSNVFVNSDKFVNPNFSKIREFKNTSYIDDTIYAYEIKGYRFLYYDGESLTDSLDFFFSYINSDQFLNIESETLKSNYSLIVQDFDELEFKVLDSGHYYYKISNPDYYCINNFFRVKINPEILEYAFPSPYKKSNKSKTIYFPIDDDYNIGEIIKVNIYSYDLVFALSKIGNVSINNGKKVIAFDNFPDSFENGVYIFSTGENDRKKIGKLIILE